MTSVVLDTYDRQLVALVQQDALMSQAELGERVSLSPAAVNRRLKRLAADGVIRGQRVEVDADALGYGLTIITEVHVESERPDRLDTLRRAFLACPQVQQCYYVAGGCDFVLVFLVRSMAQYTELTRSLFFANDNVRRFSTRVAMDRVKTGGAVPVD